jgi:diguanylate cyclase (GGDEF)-like protein
MINQLQEKYQLSLLLLLGAFTVFGIFPFVVIRYLAGNFTAAIADISIIIGIIALVSYAYYSKKVRILSAIIAIFVNICVVTIIIAHGVNGFLWVYPVFASTFILLKPKEAFGVNLVAGASIVALSDIFTVISLNSYIVTTLLLTISAFIYSNHSLKQYRLLETLNTIDALTGAFNRRALSSDIEAALSNAERNDTVQLLAMLDLDYFKKVNDKYGHAVGDQVLKDFVTITTANIRKYDRVYRYGGEEFVLLISGMNDQQHSFFNNLRAAIKKELQTPDGNEITVSFGVAAWTPETTTTDTWLKRADKALYQAKAQGRDCAIFSNE